MKYLKPYKEFPINENRLKTFLKPTTDKVKKKANQIKSLSWEDVKNYGNKIWELTKKEGSETKQAVKILRKMMSNKEVTDSEKKFLKEQSKDLVKILSTATLPMPITAILVALGKKYNFEMFPGDQTELKKQIEDEKSIVESLGYNYKKLID